MMRIDAWVAGYGTGDVKLFDLRTHSVRWETNCSMEFPVWNCTQRKPND